MAELRNIPIPTIRRTQPIPVNRGLAEKVRGESFTGSIFGRWAVGEESRRVGYKVFYSCTCSCGTTKEVERNQLGSGASKSCGCLRTEMVVARSTTHGNYSAPERRVYSSMMTRCYNTKYHEYHLYGGRGITVSDDWKGNFAKFYEDMGFRPSPEHQLDRRDNSLGYSKENCHWVTRTENARNKRTTVKVMYLGEEKPLVEIAEILGIDYHALFYRFQKGEVGPELFRPSSKVKSVNKLKETKHEQ